MSRLAMSIALIVLLVVGSGSIAAAPDADGFVPLFNGKDLTGWVPVNVAPGNTFTVNDGEIHCTGIPTGVMRTERMYENFIIEMDWMHTVPAGNSGLFIWGDGITSPGVPFARGIEVQILDDAFFTPEMKKKGFATGHGDLFAIHGATCKPDRPHPGGWMRCLPSAETTKPAGQWNHYHVECNDGAIKLTVNGTQVSGVSKCNPRKGYICLESEGGVIRFKNIRIKELPSTNAKPEETAKADVGFKALYNGIDLNDWEIDAKQEGHWKANDWTIEYDGKAGYGSRIFNKQKIVGDFQLIADYTVADGTDSLGITQQQGTSLTVGPGGDVRAATQPAQTQPTKTKSKWQRIEVTYRAGQHLRVNGKSLFDPMFPIRGINGLLPFDGKVGLRAGNESVKFANIYIRPLQPPADPRVLNEFIYEKADFPSVHASTIAEGRSGLVAAFFGGTREGATDVGIWLSRHDGKSWSAPEQVANGKQADGSQLPCWNPVLHANADGSLILFYKVGPKPSTWWGMAMSSADGGKTWSVPWRLPDGFLGPIKNKPIVLADGTLLCPSSTEDNGWQVHMEFTRDGGHTFTKTDPIGLRALPRRRGIAPDAANAGKEQEVGLIQPTILQAKDKLIALCRSKGRGAIMATTSGLDGRDWSFPRAINLPNPNSGIDGVTLADGRMLLVYNHTTTGRSPLNIAMSVDGLDWIPLIALETEAGEYSYPAVIQTKDGMVHITYTWKRQKVKHVVIDPKKIAE